MVVNVPRELEDEILSRVPDKTLARFRCACKRWNTQLVEETFLELHSSRMHNYDGEHRIITKNARSRISSVGSVLTEQEQKEDLSLINRKHSHHEIRKRIKVYKIVHCTGLLLCVMDNQLLVWNPSLKETRWVKCTSDFHWFDDAYGLGFVHQSTPTRRNYKIVRFRCARNDRGRPPKVEVYEFTSNTWKVITDIRFDWHLRVPLTNVSLGGNPYWIGLREGSSKAFIQGFDFSKERFQPLDHVPFVYDENNPLALETFRGNRLSLLEQCHQTRKITIWVRHLITPWTILMVVAIPHFPLLYQRPSLQVWTRTVWLYCSHFSVNYFVDRNETLFISLYEDGTSYFSIYRVGDKEFQRVAVETAGNSCSYVPSLARPHGFSKQDTTRIRWRKSRFN